MYPQRVSAAAVLAMLAVAAPTRGARGQSADPFPAEFELSSLLPQNGGDGSDGVVLFGAGLGNRSGCSVASAGDVNGDGVGDLFIGAYLAGPNGVVDAGASYVVFGSVGLGAGAVFELSSLDGTNGFALNGIDETDQSGRPVASAGDVNQDGFDDLLIGAWFADPAEFAGDDGESYVVFGGAGIGAGGAIELSSLDGTNGFVLPGFIGSDYSGFSVAGAGDMNDDGFDDLVIGAYGADPGAVTNAGMSFVAYGGADVGAGGSLELAALDGSNGFALIGIDRGDHSGWSVAGAGDVNDDGFDDLIIGAHTAGDDGNDRAGESYVVFGRADLAPSGLFELSSVQGGNGFVIKGMHVQGVLGRSVSAAGDVNADGIDDLIVGAPNAGAGWPGESYVVFGSAALGAGGPVDLASLDGVSGFVVRGIGLGDYTGSAVSSAGDVNNDGVDDLIIGAESADPGGLVNAGTSYVVFGGSDVGAGGVLECLSLDGANGFAIHGIDERDGSGGSISGAGDVNGDGVDDLVIGALLADPDGRIDAGESYVIFGRDLSTCPADFNGDGIADFGDIDVFIDLFVVQDSGADLNGDGIVDFGDIDEFIAAFLAGC